MFNAAFLFSHILMMQHECQCVISATLLYVMFGSVCVSQIFWASAIKLIHQRGRLGWNVKKNTILLSEGKKKFLF